MQHYTVNSFRWNCGFEIEQIKFLRTNSTRIDKGIKHNLIDALVQWFSTFGSWRPTKLCNIQSGDPFSNEKTGFGDPK